ncbi:hypothetical protein B0I00_0651 [Novosphingobium kunmingense]|uniref:Copper(I)-binding protein n=1 Tax=Novosphingobium kunmingense TaxID=1211806 RepID=A0A2N0I2Q7_9SPHN|nr:copper chaperone PCu(A)C [Novosphingobium kunmingense]PKB25451.1 hypothetical protein B0I00_0651 [Novosphingobium kunmingense]
MLYLRLAAATAPMTLGLVLLAGCKQSADTEAAPAATEARDAEAKGMELREAELILPAVKGNPGAAYLTIANPEGGRRVIAAISIEGVGRTEVHRTDGTTMTRVERVEVPPASTLSFDPGELHVMAFDVADALKSGGKTTVRVTFASGDTLAAPMAVLSVSDAAMGEDHAGMEH